MRIILALFLSLFFATSASAHKREVVEGSSSKKGVTACYASDAQKSGEAICRRKANSFSNTRPGKYILDYTKVWVTKTKRWKKWNGKRRCKVWFKYQCGLIHRHY